METGNRSLWNEFLLFCTQDFYSSFCIMTLAILWKPRVLKRMVERVHLARKRHPAFLSQLSQAILGFIFIQFARCHEIWAFNVKMLKQMLQDSRTGMYRISTLEPNMPRVSRRISPTRSSQQYNIIDWRITGNRSNKKLDIHFKTVHNQLL